MTEVITKEQKQDLIKGYNALVEDVLELGIGEMLFIDEDCPITIEELFFFQGILGSKLASYIQSNTRKVVITKNAKARQQ